MLTANNDAIYATSHDGVIYRDGISEDGIFSERTFYLAGEKRKPYSNKERDPKKIRAFLYKNNDLEQEWGPLFDLAKSVNVATFVRIDDQRNLLFALKGEDSDFIKTVTIGPDVKVKKTHNQAYAVLQSPDVPSEDAFRKRQKSWRDKTNIPFKLGMAIKDPEDYSNLILVPDEKQEGSYFILGTDGELSLPNKASALMPISTQKISGQKVLNMIQGWVLGYSKPKGKKVWGWASPELKKFTAPLWKDWDIHVDEKLEKVNFATIKDQIFYDMPLILGQHLDNSWQMYA